MSKKSLINREVSWLSFNHRVLQECRDESVPLHEKIKFMAIFSSNLDEFFRVRVAALRYLLSLKDKTLKKLDFDPAKLLGEIHEQVKKQQEELGSIYRNIILKQLQENNIHLVRETDLDKEQLKYVRQFFSDEVHPFLQPVFLFRNRVNYFLQNKALYLAVKLFSQSTRNPASGRAKYALLEIPSKNLPRFITLPDKGNNQFLMFIDDIIRAGLDLIFPGYQVDSAFAIKLTRDAEIYIEDEFSGDLVDKIRLGITRRKTGVPARFLYDLEMPGNFLKFIREALQLSKEDLIPGGRYHNFSDFFTFPPLGPAHLQYDQMQPLPAKNFPADIPIFDIIGKQDILLHFPYHSYTPVINFIKSAADDPAVSAISITLYRVSSGSQIVENLIRAAQNGKIVTAFVEVKARFDEESNIKWAEEMKRAGVRVLYSFPGLKVHAKLCLIKRGKINFAYLATGNFNEKTARVYTDFGFFTAKKKITEEVENIFSYLTNRRDGYLFKTLLVAPFNMREQFNMLIDNEITWAKQKKPAAIILKLNSLEDKKMIRKLYAAGRAGVKITIIVRGICCLKPGIKGFSENIEVFSIIDRYLEHTRVYIFHNLGQKLYYLSSADWMRRNLSHRIEVAFPITDTRIKKQLDDLINLQIRDNTKTRIIDGELKNKYRKIHTGEIINAQMGSYNYLKSLG